MADLAELWHWPPSVMWEMDTDELTTWRNIAIERYNARQQAKAANR